MAVKQVNLRLHLAQIRLVTEIIFEAQRKTGTGGSIPWEIPPQTAVVREDPRTPTYSAD